MKKNNEADLLGIKVVGVDSSFTKHASEKDTYTLTLTYGTDLTALDLDIEVSPGATKELTATDFSSPVTVTVTSEDGSNTINYTLEVEVKKNNEADLLGIKVVGEDSSFTKHASEKDTYTLTLAYGTDLTALTALDLDIEVSPGATKELTATDFSRPVTVTVTSEDGSNTINYTLEVEVQELRETFRVVKNNDQWVIANPQDEGTHAAIWKIEDLVRVGAGVRDEAFGGDIWKISDSYVLMADLDFTSDADYRDATDQSINADDDETTTGGIKAELTKNAGGDNVGFKPIGDLDNQFTGTFNGNGKTISHLYIKRPSTNRVGLFGRVSGVTLTKLGLFDVEVHGDDHVGSLVGSINLNNPSTISHTFVNSGSVTGGNNVGGLIGGMYSGSISHSYVSVSTVSGGDNTGGFGGGIYNGETTISNSIAFVDSLISTGSSSGRIGRFLFRSDRTHNHANSAMLVNGEEISSTDMSSKHGKDMFAEDFTDVDFYTNDENFSPTWDFETIWEMTTEGPVLR